MGDKNWQVLGMPLQIGELKKTLPKSWYLNWDLGEGREKSTCYLREDESRPRVPAFAQVLEESVLG